MVRVRLRVIRVRVRLRLRLRRNLVRVRVRVHLVLLLGLLDLGVELRGEVAEDAVLHAHLHAEHPVEEVLDAELVLRDARRAEGVVRLLQVRLVIC